MKLKELRKLSKKQLFELEEKMKLQLKKMPVAEENAEEREVLKYKLKKIKHYLYECRLCADANIILKINAINGEETEYFKGDCGLAVCPYKEDLERIAEGKEIEIDKIFKNYTKTT